MATTSALKSINAVDPSLLGGTASEYGKRYQEAQAAEDKLTKLLEDRQTNAVSPSMLALAGELLDPGRTGSFGEAVGRGAKAYGQMQMQEDKQLQENAMARMQLANMRLEQARKSEAMKGLTDMEPVAPVGGVGTASGAAATPQTTTLAGGPSTAPAAGQGDASGPTVMTSKGPMTPAKIRKWMLIDEGVGKALEAEYKLNLESWSTQPTGAFNKITGEFKPFPGAAPIAEPIPELGGRTLMMPPEDAVALRAARTKGDNAGVYAILDKFQKGVGARQEAATVNPNAVKEPSSAAKIEPVTPITTVKPLGTDATVEGKKIAEAAATTEATKTAEARVAEARDFIKKGGDTAYATKDAADRMIRLATSNPKAFGPLSQPGVGTAIGIVVRDGLNTPGGSISMKSIEDAIVAADPSVTQEDLRSRAILAGDAAMIELNYTQMFLSKQGSVTENERSIVRKVGTGVSDDPKVIALKGAAVSRRAKFDIDAAEAFMDFQEKTGGNIDQFKRSKQYLGLRDNYQSWVNKNFGGKTEEKSKSKPAEGGKKGYIDSSELDRLMKEKGLAPK